MKISIIGYSGAGKSTLAKQLALKHGIPQLYLDSVNFSQNWQERSLDKILPEIDSFMQNDSWVIDGNYRKMRQEDRLAQSDYIIFLNYPRRICFPSVIKRYYQNKNQFRESSANGCIEKIDWEFIKWVLHDGRTKSIKNNYANIVEKYYEKVIVAKNRKQLYMILKEKNLL